VKGGNPMETIRVIIGNLQPTPWYKEWIPIIIAIIALLTSLVSLCWTREEFIRNTRPFVWASSYGFLDHEKKTIIPIPFRIAFRVKNSPARISNLEVQINLDKDQLFVSTDENLVRFPDETSEWSFNLDKDVFEKLMNRSNEQKSKLRRIISIKYSSLGGKKNYCYKLEQSFNPIDNQWTDNNVIAD
jgi:hypothetical protein